MSPSRRSTERPALSSPSRHAPATSGVKLPLMRTEHAPTARPGRGGPSHMIRAEWAMPAATGAEESEGGSATVEVLDA